MNSALASPASARSPLAGRTVRDLMTSGAVSLPEGATVEQVVAFLDAGRFGAAPVTDDAGHPVGVISRMDVMGSGYARTAGVAPALQGRAGEVPPQQGSLRANDLMSPTVFSVSPEIPAQEAAAQMVQLNVHRLVVVDCDGVLVGVITALGLLRHFHG